MPLLSCGGADNAPPTVAVGVSLSAPEQVAVTDGLVLFFDSGGILRSCIDTGTATTLGDLSARCTLSPGAYDIVALVNIGRNFELSPVPVVGTTDIAQVSVGLKAGGDAKTAPYLWCGTARTTIGSVGGSAIPVALEKVSSVGLGIEVLPWEDRDVDVILGYYYQPANF